MLKTIEDTLGKSCLLGLSYFTVQGEPLNQNILAGRVIAVDKELGITLALFDAKSGDETMIIPSNKAANFILPTDLSCWFTAPTGDFHTSQAGVKITNPDYLVTWDIYQTKEPEENESTDSEQQWWQWQPRTQAPNVG